MSIPKNTIMQSILAIFPTAGNAPALAPIH